MFLESRFLWGGGGGVHLILLRGPGIPLDTLFLVFVSFRMLTVLLLALTLHLQGILTKLFEAVITIHSRNIYLLAD